MTPKSKAKKDMTKADLIKEISKKVKRAKPFVKIHFLRGLKYQTKEELGQILKSARVSGDGYDISTI